MQATGIDATHSPLRSRNPVSIAVDSRENGFPAAETPSMRRLVAALKDCSREMDLSRGKLVHSEAIACGLQSNVYVTSSLINMYAKCGEMADAQQLFNGLLHRNPIIWNCLIQGYLDNGNSSMALKLFKEMEQGYGGCAPTPRTYTFVLAAYASVLDGDGARFGVELRSQCLEKVKAVHSRAVMEQCCDNHVKNKLIDVYGAKCCSMEHACSVFNGMIQRDIVSWNALMKGYVENGEYELALELFDIMQEAQAAGFVLATSTTYGIALTACVSLATDEKNCKSRWLEKGKALHSQVVINNFFHDATVMNTIINLYAICGNMVHACGAFEDMALPDEASLSILLQGCVQNGESESALEMFEDMAGWFDSTSQIYVSTIAACSASLEGYRSLGKSLESRRWLEKGKSIHSQAVRSKCCDIYVESALVGMYSKCGSMIHARQVFEDMDCADTVTWTALLQGYAENGEHKVALRLFESLQEYQAAPDMKTYVVALSSYKYSSSVECVKAVHSQVMRDNCCDGFLENALIDAYAKCCKMEHARGVFDRMVHRSLAAWNCLIQGYAENGEEDLVLQSIVGMDLNGIEMDPATFVAALAACRNVTFFQQGQMFHEEACNKGWQQDTRVATALVTFYGQCGRMDAAKQVFDSIQEKPMSMWNSLLCGYTTQGDFQQAFKLFEKMRSEYVSPNRLTFTHILSACSHAGLTAEAMKYFNEMCCTYGITPDVSHYNCMVDLLGRANFVEEALELIRSMPVEPDAVTWRTLMGACCKWKNVEIGKLAYEALVHMDAHHCVAYVLMSNIYGTSGCS